MENSEAAMGTVGASVGVAIGAAALYWCGIKGFSAAGITSGLAAMGGSMRGGIGIIAMLPLVGHLGARRGYRSLWKTSKEGELGHIRIRCCGFPLHNPRDYAVRKNDKE